MPICAVFVDYRLALMATVLGAIVGAVGFGLDDDTTLRHAQLRLRVNGHEPIPADRTHPVGTQQRAERIFPVRPSNAAPTRQQCMDVPGGG